MCRGVCQARVKMHHFRGCNQASSAWTSWHLYLILFTCSMGRKDQGQRIRQSFPFLPPSICGEQLLHLPMRLGNALPFPKLAESGKKIIRLNEELVRVITEILWGFRTQLQLWCHWCTSRVACDLCCNFLGIHPIPSKTEEEFYFLRLTFLANIQRHTRSKSHHSAWSLSHSDGETRLEMSHCFREVTKDTWDMANIFKLLPITYHLFLNIWIWIIKTVIFEGITALPW